MYERSEDDGTVIIYVSKNQRVAHHETALPWIKLVLGFLVL